LLNREETKIKIEGEKVQTFVCNEKLKRQVKEIEWQSAVIRAGDGGEGRDQCGKGIGQKIHSKKTESEHESAQSMELKKKKKMRRF